MYIHTHTHTHNHMIVVATRYIFTAHLAGAVEYWLHLCSGVRSLPTRSPGYDIKPTDSEAPALGIWGMWSTPLLPLLPGPLWPGMVATDRVLSMCQIEQTVCKQVTDVKLWPLYSNTWNHFTVCKKKQTQARLRMLSTKCVYKSYFMTEMS